MVAMARTDEVSSTSPCGIMPSKAPTVERIAAEMALQDSPDVSQPIMVEKEFGSRAHQARYALFALAQNNAMPIGTMNTLANRTMALSAFMISELTFFTYFASLLMRAT